MIGKTGINWDEQPLGEVLDCELARRLGVHQTTVLYHRKRRGIPAAQRQQQPTFEGFCRLEKARGRW